MTRLTVELGARSYPIYIGESNLDKSDLFTQNISHKNLVILTNETIAPLYLDKLKTSLSEFSVKEIIIPDGEEYKTLTQLESVIGEMLKLGCARDTTLVALGGGVVGDLCGFVASTFQRGIPFVQIPTTLLSQVDSSVGGKTAVNHALGKNMIGAFYQPKAVIIDSTTLSTLPKREFAAGMAEVIKYGIIYDKDFFSWLENNTSELIALNPEALNYAIQRCCEIKAEIVAQDEKEHGLRALLNLGHTFGHAIEAEMGYGNWLHGEAVGAGMVIACQVSEQLNWMTASEVCRATNLIDAFNLPICGPKNMGYDDYLKHMQHDKKVQAGAIRFIMPQGIGKACVTSDVPNDVLKIVLN
ncbi:3-dehydroquinate synthase [Alteromonas sp. 5E99-2]|uniref:3-dehydroquinate synthase n=1 Tax=Alteromonas sp. 5E99-2 TaxID=2817683 RepID=UPI001A99CAD9|nr:3-dehydroquinate synthase [Alteromonas sp. 5E99-2]MBO1254638.1 3-dehydroquinate synthase [Alteromonas sp. 5E99-2]